jgi:hypothetical protein
MSLLFVRWPPKGIEGARVIRSHPLLAEFAMCPRLMMALVVGCVGQESVAPGARAREVWEVED